MSWRRTAVSLKINGNPVKLTRPQFIWLRQIVDEEGQQIDEVNCVAALLRQKTVYVRDGKVYPTQTGKAFVEQASNKWVVSN